MIEIQKAKIEDAEILTKIQISTFIQSDKMYKDIDGYTPPDGFDSVPIQINIINNGIYFKILLNDNIIGGIILKDKGENHMHLCRIFISSEVQNKGIGSYVLNKIEQMFSKCIKWSLDTPFFSYRNHHFYEKNGYIKVGETVPKNECGFHLYIYEKVVKPNG